MNIIQQFNMRTLRLALLALMLGAFFFAEVPSAAAADRRSKLTEKEKKQLRRKMQRKYGCPPGTEPAGKLPPDGNNYYCKAPTRKKGKVRHGEYNRWHANGEKRLYGEYYMGKRHGVWKHFRRDGSLKSQEVFYDGNRREKVIYDRHGKPVAQEIEKNNNRKNKRRRRRPRTLGNWPR